MVGRFEACPLPYICVQHPTMHNTWDDGRFTVYDISIETENSSFYLHKSTVGRRYSEFCWLRNQLKSHHPRRNPPDLPPKKLFFWRFDDVFIEKRRKGLEKFLNSLLEEKMFLSDTTFHLFVQTNLTCEEIHDFITGKTSEEELNRVWKAGGKKDQKGLATIRSSPSSDRISISSTEPEDTSFESEGLSESLKSTESSELRETLFQSSVEDTASRRGDNCGAAASGKTVAAKNWETLNHSKHFRAVSKFSINYETDELPSD